MKPVYVFEQSLDKGKKAERVIDNCFQQWFEIQTVSIEYEKEHGIDRILKDRLGREFTVEYKTDWVTDSTNNVFVETISNDKTSKPGWAFTTHSQIIL